MADIDDQPSEQPNPPASTEDPVGEPQQEDVGQEDEDHGNESGQSDEESDEEASSSSGEKEKTDPDAPFELLNPLEESDTETRIPNQPPLLQNFLQDLGWTEDDLLELDIDTFDLCRLLYLSQYWSHYFLRLITYDNHVRKILMAISLREQDMRWSASTVIKEVQEDTSSAETVGVVVSIEASDPPGEGDSIQHKDVLPTDPPEGPSTENTPLLGPPASIPTPPVSQCCDKPLWPRAQALFLSSSRALQHAYAVNGFLDGSTYVGVKLWGALTASLIVQDIYWYAAFPAYREEYSLTDILVSDSTANEYLSRSLSNSMVLSIIFGLPVAWGAFKSWRGVKDAKHSHLAHFTALSERIRAYRPHLWRDTGRWVFPFYRLQKDLNRLVRSINWDGRLTPEDRQGLFEALEFLSDTDRKIFKTEALYALAAIADGVSVRDFVRLQQVDYSDVNLRQLLQIKTRALRHLHQEAAWSTLEPGLAQLQQIVPYTVANYLLWSLGKPNHLIWHLPFWLLKEVKLYIKIKLALLIVKGIQFAISQWINQVACEQAGNQRIFVPFQQTHNCTVCSDWPVFARDIFTVQDCIAGYLSRYRDFDELQEKLTTFDISVFTLIDLSAQRFNQTQLSVILSLLEEQTPQLHTLFLNGTTQTTGLALVDAEAINRWFKRPSLEVFGLSQMGITDETAVIITTNITNSSVRYLDMDGNAITCAQEICLSSLPGNLEIFNVDSNQLKSSAFSALFNLMPRLEALKELYFDVNTNLGANVISNTNWQFPASLDTLSLADTGLTNQSLVRMLAALPCKDQLRTLILALNSSLFTQGVDVLLEYLSTNLEVLGLDQTGLSANKLGELLSVLPPSTQLKILTVMDNDGLFSNGTDAVSGLLPSSLELLDLYGTGLQLDGLETLLLNLPLNTSLNEIVLGGMSELLVNVTEETASYFPAGLKDLTVTYTGLQSRSLEALLMGLRGKSQLRSLGLGGNEDLFLNGTTTLTQYLPSSVVDLYIWQTGLQANGLGTFLTGLSEGTKLEIFSIDINPLGDAGAQVLADYFQPLQNSLETLRLSSCGIGDRGAIIIANQILKPPMQFIYWIDVLSFGQAQTPQTTPASQLATLDLQNNSIGDAGAQALCNILPQTYMSFSVVSRNYSIATYMDPQQTGLFLEDNPISPAILETCGQLSSSAASVQPWAIYGVIHAALTTAAFAFASISAVFHRPDTAFSSQRQSSVSTTLEPTIQISGDQFHKEYGNLYARVSKLEASVAVDLNDANIAHWDFQEDTKWHKWRLQDAEQDLQEYKRTLRKWQHHGSALSSDIDDMKDRLDDIKDLCYVRDTAFQRKCQYLTVRLQRYDGQLNVWQRLVTRSSTLTSAEKEAEYYEIAIMEDHLKGHWNLLESIETHSKATNGQLNAFREQLRYLADELNDSIQAIRDTSRHGITWCQSGFFAKAAEVQSSLNTSDTVKSNGMACYGSYQQ